MIDARLIREQKIVDDSVTVSSVHDVSFTWSNGNGTTPFVATIAVLVNLPPARDHRRNVLERTEFPKLQLQLHEDCATRVIKLI